MQASARSAKAWPAPAGAGRPAHHLHADAESSARDGRGARRPSPPRTRRGARARAALSATRSSSAGRAARRSRGRAWRRARPAGAPGSPPAAGAKAITSTISSNSLGWARNSDCTCTPADRPAKKVGEAGEGHVGRAGGVAGLQQARRQPGEELAPALGAGGGDAAMVPGADGRGDRGRDRRNPCASGCAGSPGRPRRR